MRRGEQARELTYASHSGYGNQYQALLAALFVANQTGRVLVVPPLLGHYQSLAIDGKTLSSRNLAGRACSRDFYKDRTSSFVTRKQLLATEAWTAIARHLRAACAKQQQIDQWSDVFNLSAYRTRPLTCEDLEVTSRVSSVTGTCRTALHADLHLGTLADNQNCQKGFSCDETLGMVGRQGWQSLVCLAQLDDWTYVANGPDDAVLRRCQRHSAHGPAHGSEHGSSERQQYVAERQHVAEELDQQGLALHHRLLESLPHHFPSRCAACAYLRMPDADHPGLRNQTADERINAWLVRPTQRHTGACMHMHIHVHWCACICMTCVPPHAP